MRCKPCGNYPSQTVPTFPVALMRVPTYNAPNGVLTQGEVIPAHWACPTHYLQEMEQQGTLPAFLAARS